MNTSIFGIFGAGGFGREIMPVAQSFIHKKYSGQGAKEFEIVFVESQPAKQYINGVRVISEIAFINASAREKMFNIAIGSSAARREVVNRLTDAGCKPFSIFANSALIYDDVDIGVGATICDHVMITSNTVIGSYFHANLYSYIAHDCVVGDYVTLAPRVSCNGNVVIEDNVYIGTGAVLKQGSQSDPLVIGQGAIIGMGAVVTKSIAPNTTVIGNPAKSMGS